MSDQAVGRIAETMRRAIEAGRAFCRGRTAPHANGFGAGVFHRKGLASGPWPR